MKLSKWAEQNDVCYQTAWNMFKQGVNSIRRKTETGSIHVIQPEPKQQKTPYTVTYARVSSSENKSNLESQNTRLRDFCTASGWTNDLSIKEIGSGLNDHRAKLAKLLSDGKPTKLVVEHKDRLARFGFNYIELLCKHISCEIVVINSRTNEQKDLIEDFVSVITSFCARIYGQRRSKRATEKLIESLTNDQINSTTNLSYQSADLSERG